MVLNCLSELLIKIAEVHEVSIGWFRSDLERFEALTKESKPIPELEEYIEFLTEFRKRIEKLSIAMIGQAKNDVEGTVSLAIRLTDQQKIDPKFVVPNVVSVESMKTAMSGANEKVTTDIVTVLNEQIKKCSVLLSRATTLKGSR